MKKIWILTANRTDANIYKVGKKLDNLEHVKEMKCEEARLSTKNFRTDKQGFFQKSFSEQRGMSGGLHSENSDLLHQFSKEVADYINSAKKMNEFEDLFVVSSKQVLGDLRKKLTKQSSDSLVHAYPKNPHGMTDDQILKYIEFTPEELVSI